MLQPYFDIVYRDLAVLTDSQRTVQLKQYSAYIELSAQKAKSAGVRMQLRINLHALRERLGESKKTIEVNVRPRSKSARISRLDDAAYVELFDALGAELANE